MNTRALLLTAVFSIGTAFAQEEPPPVEAPSVEAPASQPVTYKLGKGILIVKVMKDPDTLAAGLSHDHAVAAKGWHGTFTVDPANPVGCEVDVTVPVANLTPDEPASRKHAGIEGEVSDGQRADIKKNILSAGQLDAKAFPTITFKAKECAVQGGTLNVTGDLTIKGKTNRVVIPIKGFEAGDNLAGRGIFTVSGSDFGVQPYSAMFGQLKNEDAWTFDLTLKGRK